MRIGIEFLATTLQNDSQINHKFLLTVKRWIYKPSNEDVLPIFIIMIWSQGSSAEIKSCYSTAVTATVISLARYHKLLWLMSKRSSR